MKVLLIGDYPPPLGGIAVHLQQLQRSLQALGAQPRVLDIGKGAARRAASEDVLPVRSGGRLLLELARDAARGFTLHLHTSGNNPKAWALIGLVAQVPAPKVVTLHSGLLPAFLGASGLRRLAARTALRGFDRVVAVSQPLRAALVEAGVEEARIEVYPAFCASQVVPGSLPAGFEAIRARRSPLLSVQHHPSKVYGRELIFEATAQLARRFPDVGLAVFGSGTADPSFAAAARAHRVEGLIEDLGELDHGAALAVIGACDAFVRPTTADGDSISVREALTLGTRCVASDVCARPQGTITFRGGDAAHLVEQLTSALLRPALPVQSPDAGPWLLEIYQRLLARPAQLSPARL